MPLNTYAAVGIVTHRLGNCSRIGMAIAAPLWSCMRNEACRLWAGLSMVDSRRVPVQDNSIVGASAAR